MRSPSVPGIAQDVEPQVIKMRIRTWVLLLSAATLGVLAGCHGKGSPTAPPAPDITAPREAGTQGHVLWGAWEAVIDRDTLEVVLQPMRMADEHFNVTGFVTPPKCSTCISMQVLDVDFPSSQFSVRVMLRNPTGVTGYDVRGILFISGDQELLSADNWTELFDIPGDYQRNPFQAFARETYLRKFGGGETHSATYRLYLPPGNMAVKFAVEASYPGNCPEPYETDIVKGIDFLSEGGTYSEKIEVRVDDWQNDIASVQLDLSSLGATTPVNLTFQGGLWKATVSNTYGATTGFYLAWLQAHSPTGPWIYQPMDIEVKSLGQDRLPPVLGLMHNWTSGGDPKDPLTKNNMKYEGIDLNWIIPDTGYGSTRLPYYDGIHRAPLTTVGYCTTLLDNLEAQTDPPSLYNLLTIGSQQLGETFSPTSFAYTPTASPIADAMEALYSAIGSSLSSTDKSTIASQTAGLPIELQYMTAAILKAVSDGYSYRQTAISGYSSEVKDILFNNGTDWVYGTSIYVAVLQEAVEFDYPSMYRAAGPVLQAMDGMRDLGLYYVPRNSSSWTWNTPIGTVKIGGSGYDAHTSGEYLLILDPGGNDTYNCQAGGNASLSNPFSICIDLAGDDAYSNQGNWNYSQGAGRVGVGVLWDVYGDDDYQNFRFCQGFGHWGVGVLLDSAGNDSYNSDGCSQGSGYYGIGMLIDEWGGDTYNCYQYSQGFGFVKGWGLAYDQEGNDKWVANDTDIKYPSPQTSEHNTSMSQGQGFGLRWDDQPVWQSGGQGILFDHAGDDQYSCGVFGQACAYWFGTGIVADYGGTDSMYGIWYVQSGAAHYGTSFLINKGQANDTYQCTMNVSQGGGHDFSNSFFLEEGGNDVYTSPGISLGAGNECGTGVFVDYSGNDTYHNTAGNSMGQGAFSDGRPRGSWGVFLDLGETESYEPGKTGPGENITWTLGDIGAGGDYAGGVVIWQ